MLHRMTPQHDTESDLPTSLPDKALSQLLREAAFSDELTQLLFRALRLGLSALNETKSQPQVSFRDATVARLHAARHRRAATRADLRSYTQRFLRFSDWEERPLCTITADDCRELLEKHFHISAHVYRKAQMILHGVFAFGKRQGWCLRNPTDGLERPCVQEETITPLSLPQIQTLLRTCQRERLRKMEAAVRLMLWCGIRPTEVQRLTWGDIDGEERCVYVPPRHSKTGGARAVPLRGGALALLCEHHAADERIAPTNWQRLWRDLRRSSRLSPWRQDTLRHTFASMHLKHFHNLPLLQEEMGHRDSALLRSRYLNLRALAGADARAFFTRSFL